MNNTIETLLLSLRDIEYIELFVYIFIIFFLIYGWRKGFLLQFFYLMVLLISIALSFRYSYQVGSYISSWFNSNIQLSEIFGGVLIFITVLTVSSFFQNFIDNNQKQRDVGNKLLGGFVSILVSNLILTLIFTVTSIISVPQFLEDTIENSNLVSFYTDTSGTPQQALELITGTDLIKVVSRIKDLTGKSSVVVSEQGCIEIPKYSLSNLSNNNDQKNDLYALLLVERSNQNLAPLELSETLSEISLSYAYEMYQNGFWCHKNPKNGELVGDRLSKKGIPYIDIGENLALSSSVRSGHISLMNSESHKNTILDNEFKRVGIGIVSGPLGLIIVQIFSS
tara:strand:- start:2432 stop:3445 length:1014 start_codon:yes stop_codon:yes gene_type:complete